MSIEEIKKQITQDYIDQDYQVTIDKNPGKWTTGNGLLHNGVFYSLLGINDLLDINDQERALKAITLCWVRSVKYPERLVFGLLNRNYGRFDKQAQDDYIGVAATSFFCGLHSAQFICEYGEKTNYSFDNTAPFDFNFPSWHGRFIGLIGFYRIAANIDPGFFQTLSLVVKFRGPLSDDHSGNILGWLQAKVIKKASQDKRLLDSVQGWEERLKTKYGTLGTLFSSYFGSSHPFSRYDGVI